MYTLSTPSSSTNNKRCASSQLITDDSYIDTTFLSTSKKAKISRNVITPDNDEPAEEDHIVYECVVCASTIYDGVIDEESIQCIKCRKWSHEKCIGEITGFTLCDICR